MTGEMCYFEHILKPICMKKIFALALTACLVVLATSCDNTPALEYTATAVTEDVTDVSLASFTFNATFNLEATRDAATAVGIYLSRTAGVDASNNLMTTDPDYYETAFSNKVYTYPFNNTFLWMGGTKNEFEAGTTVYYRAYITVVSSEGAKTYYGEEKSFVVPAE